MVGRWHKWSDLTTCRANHLPRTPRRIITVDPARTDPCGSRVLGEMPGDAVCKSSIHSRT
jgi:hypothetical protein